jgi:hypothetical protein
MPDVPQWSSAGFCLACPHAAPRLNFNVCTVCQEFEMNDVNAKAAIEMHADNMYREEVFTDHAVGTIRRMTPVTRAGEPDPGRSESFVGSTQVMTQAGPLPLNFEIEATSLPEAIANFGKAATEAFEQTMEELRELQRQQASSIVVPGGRSGGGFGGGLGGGLGGGKIQIP